MESSEFDTRVDWSKVPWETVLKRLLCGDHNIRHRRDPMYVSVSVRKHHKMSESETDTVKGMRRITGMSREEKKTQETEGYTEETS